MTKVKQWREWLVLGWETGTFASFRLRRGTLDVKGAIFGTFHLKGAALEGGQ